MTPAEFSKAVQPQKIDGQRAITFATWFNALQPPPPPNTLEHLSRSFFYLPEAQIDANMPHIATALDNFLQVHQSTSFVTAAVRPDSSQTWMLGKLLGQPQYQRTQTMPDFFMNPGTTGQPTLIDQQFRVNTQPLVIVDDRSMAGNQIVQMIEVAHNQNPLVPVFVGLHALTVEAHAAIQKFLSDNSITNVTVFSVNPPIASELNQAEQDYLSLLSYKSGTNARTPVIYGSEIGVSDNDTFFAEEGSDHHPVLIDQSPTVRPYRRRSTQP